jgi:hypothetical protein
MSLVSELLHHHRYHAAYVQEHPVAVPAFISLQLQEFMVPDILSQPFLPAQTVPEAVVVFTKASSSVFCKTEDVKIYIVISASLVCIHTKN